MTDQPGATELPSDRAVPGAPPPTAMPPTATTPTTPPKPKRPFTQTLGRIVVGVLLVLVVVFGAVNRQYVDFKWVFGESEVVETGGVRTAGGVPLIMLLGAAFIIGLLVGLIVARRRSKARLRAAATPAR